MDGFALPEGNKTGPNCGVTAVAICAGVPFTKVWDVFRIWRRSNWKGWSTVNQQLMVLDLLQIKYEEVKIERMTLKQFALANPTGTYKVRTHRHVQVVRDGVIIDQFGPKAPADHWKGGNRVLTVFKIIGA